MIIDLLIFVAKIAGILIVLLIARAFYVNSRTKAKIKRLVDQGMESYPGNETFLLGAVASVGEERKKRLSE